MSMTSELRDELLKVSPGTDNCRRASVAAILRVCAEIRMTSGGIKIEAEVPTEAVGRMLRRELAEQHGVKATIVAIDSNTHLAGRYHVVVGGESGGGRLAAASGLIDRNGDPILGLPPLVIGGSPGEAAAALRGIFLVSGKLKGPTHSPALELACPTPEAACGVQSCADRAGVLSVLRSRKSISYVIVRDPDDIACLLTMMGAVSGRMLWERQRSRQIMIRKAQLSNANTLRATRAAVDTAAKVAAALEVLGDAAPPHLAAAGRLRLERKTASLDELGRASNPPVSKDTMAGQLRRLIIMAEQRKTDTVAAVATS